MERWDGTHYQLIQKNRNRKKNSTMVYSIAFRLIADYQYRKSCIFLMSRNLERTSKLDDKP